MKFTRDKEKIIWNITKMIIAFNKEYDVRITNIDIIYEEDLKEIKLEIKG